MALNPKLSVLTILNGATTSEILDLSELGYPRAVMASIITPATLTETINIECSPNVAFTAGETGLLTSGGTVVDIAVASRATPLYPICSRYVRLKATVALAGGNRLFQWQSQPVIERLSL